MMSIMQYRGVVASNDCFYDFVFACYLLEADFNSLCNLVYSNQSAEAIEHYKRLITAVFFIAYTLYLFGLSIHFRITL